MHVACAGGAWGCTAAAIIGHCRLHCLHEYRTRSANIFARSECICHRNLTPLQFAHLPLLKINNSPNILSITPSLSIAGSQRAGDADPARLCAGERCELAGSRHQHDTDHTVSAVIRDFCMQSAAVPVLPEPHGRPQLLAGRTCAELINIAWISCNEQLIIEFKLFSNKYLS